MDNTRFKISIQFELENKGEWNGFIVAAESLIAMAVDKLEGDNKPIDYKAIKAGKTFDTFELIFERAFPDRICALTWAKGIEEAIFKTWKSSEDEIKNAKVNADGIKIDEIKTKAAEAT